MSKTTRYGAIPEGHNENHQPTQVYHTSNRLNAMKLTGASLIALGVLVVTSKIFGQNAPSYNNEPLTAAALPSIQGEYYLKEATAPRFMNVALSKVSSSSRTNFLDQVRDLHRKYVSPSCKKAEANVPQDITQAMIAVIMREMNQDVCEVDGETTTCEIDFASEPSGQTLLETCEGTPGYSAALQSTVSHCEFPNMIVDKSMLNVPICFPDVCGAENTAHLIGGTIDIMSNAINHGGDDPCSFEYKVADTDGNVLVEEGDDSDFDATD